MKIGVLSIVVGIINLIIGIISPISILIEAVIGIILIIMGLILIKSQNENKRIIFLPICFIAISVIYVIVWFIRY